MIGILSKRFADATATQLSPVFESPGDML
jgi:hypothetical protein